MDNFTKDFLDNILNSIADPVFVKDETHRWIQVNEAFCKLIGHKKEEVLNKSDFDFFPKEQAEIFWKYDEIVFQSEEENLNEEIMTSPSGESYIIETRKNIVKNKKGEKFLVGVIRNITEKKQLINDLKQSNTLLENFAYIASHDLKAPLNTISNHANILSESAREKLNPSEKKSLQFIAQSSKNLGLMVRSLLSFSKAKTAKLLLQEHNIKELILTILKTLESELNTIPHIISWDEFPDTLEVDGIRIKQIFQNLLSNALKFRMPDRTLKLHLGFKELSNDYEFSLKDNGQGIPEGDQDRIFSLFERLDERRKSGSGIGLSICELIAIQHGGRIWVESEENKGSTFYFTISKNIKQAEKFLEKDSIRRE